MIFGPGLLDFLLTILFVYLLPIALGFLILEAVRDKIHEIHWYRNNRRALEAGDAEALPEDLLSPGTLSPRRGEGLSGLHREKPVPFYNRLYEGRMNEPTRHR